MAKSTVVKKLFILFVLLLVIGLVWYKQSPELRSWVNQKKFYVRHPDVVGGPCGPLCGGIYEYPKDQALSNTDSLPDFANDTTKKLLITGTIYDIDGKPAKDVIYYIYHSDDTGLYPRKGDEKGADSVHGYIRGWIKTMNDGRYAFYTRRPGLDIANKNRAHIHCIVKEPSYNEYALSDLVFPDDPWQLEVEKNTKQTDNGGMVKFLPSSDTSLLICERNIYLGRNIFNYPVKK